MKTQALQGSCSRRQAATLAMPAWLGEAGLAMQTSSKEPACSRCEHSIDLEWQTYKGLHRKWQWLHSTPCTMQKHGSFLPLRTKCWMKL